MMPKPVPHCACMQAVRGSNSSTNFPLTLLALPGSGLVPWGSQVEVPHTEGDVGPHTAKGQCAGPLLHLRTRDQNFISGMSLWASEGC